MDAVIIVLSLGVLVTLLMSVAGELVRRWRNTSLLLLLLSVPSLHAQTPDMPIPKETTHERPRYWSRETKVVFTAETAAAVSDTWLTCRNLDAGGRELTLPIHSCAQMVGFQVGIHAAAQGVAWLLLRTGHPHLSQLPRAYLLANNTEGAIFSATH